MKNPNGYGSVYKLSGKRRKPFGVRITTGWEMNDETGKVKQIYRNLGYYKTRTEAKIALAQYNANPYSEESAKLTFAEIFDKWSERKFDQTRSDKISQSSIYGYTASYKESEELHDMVFKDLKTDHLQKIVDKCDKGHGTKRKLRVLYSQLYKYAMKNDLVDKDYSRFIELGVNDEGSSRKPFTKKEIKKLWDNVHRMDYIDTVLIMIYTGLRPGELVLIETSKINIPERYMRGGIKTAAGKDRVIPINKKILPFIEKRIAEGHDYLLINSKQQHMKYRNYYDEKWKPIMEQLKMSHHRPHECRHTFASLMNSAGANKLCIKRIMGHASKDITDKVYTHKDIEELKAAVDLL